MPIFEFRCLDCEKDFETLVLDKDDEVTCFSCGGNKLEKQFSPFGIKSQGEILPSNSSAAGSCCSPAGCGCGVKN